MKIFSFFFKLMYWGFAVLLLTWAMLSFEAYFGFVYFEEKNLCIELIESGDKTVGKFHPDLMETKTVQIGNALVGDYIVKYSFEVGGETYFGQRKLKVIPDKPKVMVSYLSKNPNQNFIHPEQRLKAIEETEFHPVTLLIAVGSLLLGLFLIFRGNRKNNKIRKAKLESLKPKSTPLPSTTNSQSKNQSKIGNFKSTFNSKPTFKETDHSRFMPPSIPRYEEEK